MAGKPIPPPPAALVGVRPAETAVRTITAEDLIGLRDIDTFTVSPDGRRVAYLLRRADHERDAYDTGWFVADVVGDAPPVYLGDGGEPQLATLANGHQVGDIAASPARWSPDGRWVAYLVEREGAVQLWRSRADGSRREQLTRLPADARAFCWSRNGRAIFVSAWRLTREAIASTRAAEARRGFLLDDRFLPGHSTEPYYRATDASEHPLARGRRAAMEGYDADAALWVVELPSRRVRAATTEEVAAFVRSPGSGGYERPLADVAPPGVEDVRASQDGRMIAWTNRANGAGSGEHTRQLVAAPLDAFGEIVRCSREVCLGTVEAMGWNADGGEVIFRRRFGLAQRFIGLYAWSPSDDRVREILTTDAVLEDCHTAGDVAVCTHETATTPRRLVAVDLASGVLRTIVDPNPELEVVRFGDVRVVDLTNTFGHESFAHVLTPPDYVEGRTYPVVVVTYRSRGFLRGGVGDEYPLHPFAAAGFVVLSFDMPDAERHPAPDALAAAWPGCPDCASGLLRHYSAAASLELGLATLEERGLMEPSRVAVTGLSSGAAIVFDALMTSDRRFAAAIASYAAGDPISAYVGHRPWREAYFQSIGGLPQEGGRAYLEQVSPAWNADRITAPLLMNVSDRELIMSMQTIATLGHKGRPLEVFVYPDERHVKRSPAHRYAIYRRNLQWLRFWLQGVEPEAPLDPEQIARWRELRARQERGG